MPASDRITRIFSWTVFPLVMTIGVGAAIAMLESGVEPWRTIPVVSGVTLVVVLVLERIFPYQERWLHSTGDLQVDIGFAVVDGVLLEAVRPLILVPGLLFAGWLSARVGFGLWPVGSPIVAQLLLALVFAEFFKYWVHRWEHEYDILWRIHATHHSVPRLYWLNAARFHPIDIGLDTVVGVGSLAMVGAPESVMALFLVVGTIHGFFQHANLQLRCGPLNWFFSMAELHRWHHSPVAAEANHNYGQNLIVWDVVFGTRWLPTDREPPAAVGLEDLPGFPQTLLGQLASPFRWARIKATRPEGRVAASA